METNWELGLLSPEEASERPQSTFQYLKGLQEIWRGTFYKGMGRQDMGEQL